MTRQDMKVAFLTTSRRLPVPFDPADSAFLDLILAVASGQPCAAERHGQRAIAIWKRGVTL